MERGADIRAIHAPNVAAIRETCLGKRWRWHVHFGGCAVPNMKGDIRGRLRFGHQMRQRGTEQAVQHLARIHHPNERTSQFQILDHRPGTLLGEQRTVQDLIKKSLLYGLRNGGHIGWMGVFHKRFLKLVRRCVMGQAPQ